MPELPEVETVRRSLEKRLLGRKIKKVNIFMPKLIKIPGPEDFERGLEGARIDALKRRGKYLLICLSTGFIWVTHLRMTGQLIYSRPNDEVQKHTHLIFELDNGDQLRYVDIRRFGTIYLLKPEEFSLVKGLRELGPEPLGDDFSFEKFSNELKNKKGKLKQLLLDQRFIAGIGNIYADEILFDAGLQPERLANTLNDDELQKLYRSIRSVLQLGIANRGTSMRNYVDGDGRTGDFQKLLKVYGKGGQPCPKCGRILLKQRVGGRSSCYCKHCQK
ncbi:DNA-formamidopyrimidine glycosylase [Bacillota bacterium LX-D]|nr:DNA-formamidopyrimidine glycosylase [Bacillota bacterium LX-D]